MIGEQTNKVFVPQDHEIFAGLDVGKTSIAVTYRDHGELVKSLSMPYSSEHLLNYTRKHFSHQRVVFAYEAGPTGYGLYDDLTNNGYRCLVVAPSMVPQAPGARVKTNRIDSNKLSLSLRGGQLNSIHVPTKPYRHLRHLTQLRDTFVRQRAATKCRIKSLLLFEGTPFPKASAGKSQWTLRVINELRDLPVQGAVRFKLDQLLAAFDFNKKQVFGAQREIHRFCKNEPEIIRCIQYLTSLPGIGWIVASHLLARIGDWRLIQNCRQISAFLGLVPCESSTGENVNKGRITRTGDARLRGKLIQSAWAAIRKDSELREFYQRIFQRHPRDRAARKAIVAVARKLTSRIYSVLKEQRPYVIRQTNFSVPLTAEETAGPRERLDDRQNRGYFYPGSITETESPGHLA